MIAVILVGTPLVALLVMLVVVGQSVHRSWLQRRAASLQLRLSKLQTDLNGFIIEQRSELSPDDLKLADELLFFRGKSVARTQRLFRSYRHENKAHHIIGITRYAVDRVEPVINHIAHPDLRDFYRRYQQILFEGLEAHLPAGAFARWLPPKWRIALLPKATHDRQLRGLDQWYARRVYELRA